MKVTVLVGGVGGARFLLGVQQLLRLGQFQAQQQPGTPNASADSHEAFLHRSGVPSFWVDTAQRDVHDVLATDRLERAIGVIYRPHTERASHYFGARLADQFDAVIHFDRTRAVEPLEPTSQWGIGEPAETFPSGV